MRFVPRNNAEHFLVLGAGASVDYGLPVWKDLSLLINEKIKKDTEDYYLYKKEMLIWMDKVGEEKKYNTIDKCVKEESVSKEYQSIGDEVENQIFLVIRDIFDEVYKEDVGGWIRILNEKILHNKKIGLEHDIAFINYNYDNVLDKNFLDFTYLAPKLKRYVHKNRLSTLSVINTDVLYPHGNFFSKQEFKYISRLNSFLSTMKSGDKEHMDAVSCHESYSHSVRNDYSSNHVKLYLLGLGWGLQVNLDNINFLNPISEIHITIGNTVIKDEIINFLSEKYNIPTTEIKIYATCDELVRKCFNN